MIIRAPLERALIDELAKAGIEEPRRIYRPAIEVRNELSEYKGEFTELLRTAFGKPDRNSPPIDALFNWQLQRDNFCMSYSLVEKPRQEGFSLERIDEAIRNGKYNEFLWINDSLSVMPINCFWNYDKNDGLKADPDLLPFTSFGMLGRRNHTVESLAEEVVRLIGNRKE